MLLMQMKYKDGYYSESSENKGSEIHNLLAYRKVYSNYNTHDYDQGLERDCHFKFFSKYSLIQSICTLFYFYLNEWFVTLVS
jgi:hypothetical protein